MRVLIVDDHEDNLDLLRTILTGAGHSVVSAMDGVEALKVVGDGFDLIVADILMPRMDGYALCRAIKAHPEWQRIPFVFYTATYTDAADRRFGLSLGASRFLIKPLEPVALLRELNGALSDRVPTAAVDSESLSSQEYLATHNARLVEKLDAKVAQLTATNAELVAAIAAQEHAEVEGAVLRAQLLQASKLEAVGRLAAGVAHDFNNLLTTILVSADEAREVARDPDIVRNASDRIVLAAERARDMVRQMLDFSNQRPTARTLTDLSAVVDDAVTLLRPVFPPTVQLDVSLATDVPHVLADASQLHRIVVNLATNAWQAMPAHGGRIAIGVRAVTRDADLSRRVPGLTGDRYAVLSVADDGVGIAAEHLDRIFDPFYSTKLPDQGTGLGLSVVFGLVQAMEGAVSVTSTPGSGAVFEVFLPASDATDPSKAEVSPLGRGERILYVDDEEALRRPVAAYLHRIGYDVTTAGSAAEALGHMRHLDFDLVITDLSMPGGSGIDLAKQVLAQRPDARISLTTAYAAELGDADARAMGFAGMLQKPFTLKQLGEHATSALKGVPSRR